jgi:hypothetical protein
VVLCSVLRGVSNLIDLSSPFLPCLLFCKAARDIYLRNPLYAALSSSCIIPRSPSVTYLNKQSFWFVLTVLTPWRLFEVPEATFLNSWTKAACGSNSTDHTTTATVPLLQAGYNLVTVFVIPLPYLLLPPAWYSAQIASLSRTLNSPITEPLKGVQFITVLQSNT